MNVSDLIRTQLLVALVECSKENPNEFFALRKQDLDSGLVRQIVADLRIEGHVEEQARGVIRLTQLGVTVYTEGNLHCGPWGAAEVSKTQFSLRQ
jgi:hypothetical protein